MLRQLEKYINPAFVYNFDADPTTVCSEEDALRLGLNCEAMAHLAIKEPTGYELPHELRCAESYADRERFTYTEGTEDL